MRIKLILAIFGTLGLAVLLIASLYVVQQRQDIRQRAANDVEFLQITPPVLKKGGKAQVAVVVNQLDPKFDYRLVFGLSYEENPEFPKGPSLPNGIRKTRMIKENKTYKFTFKADDCRFVAKLDVQLYYKEKTGKWQPVNAPTTTGNVKLDVDCIEKWPTPAPVQPVATPADASASAQPQPTPSQPSPSPEITQPDQGSLNEPDSEAEPIENLEDTNVLEQESQQAAASSPNPSPTSELANQQINPTPSPSPSVQPTPSTLAQLIASPTPQPSPTETAVLLSPSPSTTSGGFGALLNQNNNQTAAMQASPINETTTQSPTNQLTNQLSDFPLSASPLMLSTDEPSEKSTSQSQPLLITSPSPSITAISVKSNIMTYVILAVAALGLAGLGLFLLK